MNEFLGLILTTAMQHVVETLIALAVAYGAQVLYKKTKYSGWVVFVTKPSGEEAKPRPVGQKKMEEILDDLTTMSVYLKGLVSPFGWLIIDLVVEGPEMGVLKIDQKSKTITIDLSVKGAVKEQQKG